jgi:ParB/RepB/Spo0J family partition protein
MDDDAPETDRKAERPPQREGLPAHYRMRAERHYVDSINSGSAGVPIRLIPLSQFDQPPAPPAAGLDPLIKSIRQHGIIQPLLVRKRLASYEVIAGRRRFAAAAALGFTEVPCVLHQVDDGAAAALAAAENIHLTTGEQASMRSAMGTQIVQAVARIAEDLARLRSSLASLRTMPDGFERSVSVDLASAQALRALWLANSTALLAGGRHPAGRRRPLSSILDDVVRQFEPECRLTGLRLDATNLAPPLTLDDALVTVALTGAVMVTLTLLDGVSQPVVELATRALDGGGVSAEVVQRHVSAPPDLAEQFASRTRAAWTPMLFGIGALALEQATAAHGGTSDLMVLEEAGTAIQLTFCRV